jgi:hypothetical protein
MADEATTPSQRVLDEIISRAVKLLGFAGTNQTVLTLLRKHGFTPAAQDEGWRLIQTASGYAKPKAEPPKESPAVREADEAQAELDNWDEPNFRLIRAALARRHADTLAYLFRDDLEAKQGAEAVLSVKTLLDRVETLQRGGDATRPDAQKARDQEALKLLAERGYTAELWAKLGELVRRATQAADVPPSEPPLISATERQAALLELYGWYKDWSEVAHVYIKRRDYLIGLGLAERKKKKKPA